MAASQTDRASVAGIDSLDPGRGLRCLAHSLAAPSAADAAPLARFEFGEPSRASGSSMAKEEVAMWTSFYRDGGWGMHPTSLFGLLLLAVSALNAFRPGERLSQLVGALGILTFAAGLLGTCVGLCKTFLYIGELPVAEQLQTMALGCQESLHCVILALILIVLAGLVTIGGLLRKPAGA